MTPSVSTSGRNLAVVDLDRVPVPGRVVRLPVEPAAGDDAHPGASQHPDGVRVVDGFVTLPDLPGIGFEGKADLYREMRALAG